MGCDEGVFYGSLPLYIKTGLAELADFVAKAEPELVGNAMLCAINQAVYLLKRQIESQGRRFLQEGEFTENMYHQRRKARFKGRSPEPWKRRETTSDSFLGG
jgi:four helix bundle suffix protein